MLKRLTPAEFANLNRVSVRTVQNWAARGVIPQPERHGKAVRYVVDALGRPVDVVALGGIGSGTKGPQC